MTKYLFAYEDSITEKTTANVKQLALLSSVARLTRYVGGVRNLSSSPRRACSVKTALVSGNVVAR